VQLSVASGLAWSAEKADGATLIIGTGGRLNKLIAQK
jgi:hypothetical protein